MPATHYVHPIHGICRVVGTQRREVGDEVRTYLELRVDASPSGRPGLSVLLPADEILEHVREVADPATARAALDALTDAQPSRIAKASSWRSRVAKAESAIDAGDLPELARVYRDLEHRHLDRGLSSTERQVADRVHDLIVGELVGALDWSVERAMDAVAERLGLVTLEAA